MYLMIGLEPRKWHWNTFLSPLILSLLNFKLSKISTMFVLFTLIKSRVFAEDNFLSLFNKTMLLNLTQWAT